MRGVVLVLVGALLGGCKVTECGRLKAELEVEVAKGAGSCTTPSDCACYNGGPKPTGCGGIARKETADKIALLTTEWRRADCGNEVQCAAWVCAPECVSGKCANNSLKI